MISRAVLGIKDGFEGRAWLTEAEWATYRRKVAVRYNRSKRATVVSRPGDLCFTCGEAAVEGHKMQLAHRIPCRVGVIDWGLTPDWLDHVDNLCLAHSGACNHAAELTTSEIAKFLRASGLDLAESPAVASGEMVVTFGADDDIVEFRHGISSAAKGKK